MKASTLALPLLLAVSLSGCAPRAVAQQDMTLSPSERLAPVSFMEFREIGPAVVGGRISDIAVDEANPRVIYVGTATGGLWKSTSHGTTWEPVFTDQTTSSIGDVTLAPSNPNVVWVGTGEPQNRQSSPWGDGVFRSLDGGRSWQNMGLRATRHIARIQIHPRNPDVVYVAAVGELWDANPERGVYRTTDGGRNWERVLFVDDNTGAIDLVMDPSDPKTLYAAMYQRRRTPFGFNGGGPGSGIYRSLDGGDSWEELTDGLPDGDKGRIGLAVYRRDPNQVFAIVQATGGGNGVYRSWDRGESWEKTSDTNPRPMYYSQIWVDPNNPERVYLGGADLWRSDDGARSFTDDGAENVHLDHHALWIDPNNSDHLLIGSDGGVSVSWDGSRTWRFYDNLPLAQFYEIGFTHDSRSGPYTVCGGLQDNGSWCATTNTLDSQGIRNADWFNIGGGDGFYTVFDPMDPTTVYAESQNGFVMRRDLRTGEQKWILPQPDNEAGEGSVPVRAHSEADAPDEDEREYRGNWNTPIAVSHHDRNTVYVGYQFLLRSQDRGQSWEEVSPDLTHDIDRNELPIMGALPTAETLSRNDGTSNFSTLTTIGESPMNADVIYTGSDDGRLMGTQDGGATWSELTPSTDMLPERTYVSRVVASAHDEGTVYATFDGHQTGDYRPHVFRSDDYGMNWSRITNGLPQWSVNVIVEHPDAEGLLFLGNEVGVFVSLDRGTSWERMDGGLPTVPVDDLQIHPQANDLVVGTHGRGIWLMEDIGPLEELARTPMLADAAHLYRIGRVEDWRTWNYQEWTGRAEFRASNPRNGAPIRYWIPEPTMMEGDDQDADAGEEMDGETAEDDGTLDIIITTPGGQSVRTLSGPSAPGAHEVWWDFRIDPPFTREGAGGGGGFFGGGAQGPKVMPGVYQVRVEYDGGSLIGDLAVRLDPRIEVNRADLQARQDALMDIYGLQKPEYEANRALDRIGEQLDGVEELLGTADEVPEELTAEIEAIRDAADELDDELGELGVNFARFTIESSTTAPTEDQLLGIDRAWRDAPGIIDRINELVTSRVPALYDRVSAAGLTVVGEAIEMPSRGGGN